MISMASDWTAWRYFTLIASGVNLTSNGESCSKKMGHPLKTIKILL